AEARGAVEQTIAAYSKGDTAALGRALADDAWLPTFEIDLDGKPVRLATRADGVRYNNDVLAALQGMKATIKVELKSIEWRAAAGLAVCAIEHEPQVTTTDGKTMTQPSRATVVLRKGTDGWRWMHWHTSLSVAAAAGH